MAILVTGNTFADGDQVTSSKLNNIANAATFASGAVDGTTTTLTGGGAIQVGTIQTGNIASDAVTTAKIADATDTATGVTPSYGGVLRVLYWAAVLLRVVRQQILRLQTTTKCFAAPGLPSDSGRSRLPR